MLDCSRNRLDYGKLLIPPEGYQLDHAIAATYSADLGTLLSIPVALVYAQTLEGDLSGARLQLLEAVHQFSQRVKVYHQTGRLHVPKQLNWLYAYLEDTLVPILPESAFSAFHPKVWILRYSSTDEDSAKPARYRLIVLSRNLTSDRSWDVAASFDGTVGTNHQPANRPLIDFIQWLDGKAPCAWSQLFCEELARTNFETPEGFETHEFHPTGFEGYRQSPLEDLRPLRSIVMSPFMDDATVELLKSNTRNTFYLFSEPHEFAKLSPKLLKRIGHNGLYQLSDQIVHGELNESSESQDEFSTLQKLHAKVFILRMSESETRWYLGSANATQAARERNIEFMVGLSTNYPSARVGHIRKTLTGGESGNGPFVHIAPEALEPVNSEAENLQQALRQYEHALLKAKVSGIITQSANQLNWDLSIVFDLTAQRAHKSLKTSIRPFNQSNTTKRQALNFGQTNQCVFQNIGETELSRFLQVRIEGLDGETCHEFLLRIEIEGLPEGRLDNILRKIVDNQDKFFEYLRLLLSDEFDKEALLAGMEPNQTQQPANSEIDGLPTQLPIYEQLLRMASRSPNRLAEIDRLIRQLTEDDSKRSVVPDEFIAFWDVFRSQIPSKTGNS